MIGVSKLRESSSRFRGGEGAGRLLFTGVARDGLVPFVESPLVSEKEASVFKDLVLGEAEAGFLFDGVRKKLATLGVSC